MGSKQPIPNTSEAMTPREERGLVIAAKCKIEKGERGRYLVPSQSKYGSRYDVERYAHQVRVPQHLRVIAGIYERGIDPTFFGLPTACTTDKTLAL